MEEEKRNPRTQLQALPIATGPIPENIWESSDELSAEVFERFGEELVDQATAARTIQELEAEILILQDLEEQARQVVHSGVDRKWEELSNLLHHTPEMHDAEGRQRKLIIFTEHRGTLHYLTDRIRGPLGSTEAVETIHGGISREDRRDVQARFRNDPTVRVLLAADAAGEGVNLQTANLMVNYDLPWNPNRIEQRFGRIHRIGQTEVCHLWNMVALDTREGEVFICLFNKIEVERTALGGRVFDILGEVFENRSLKDLLIEAIRYGENPEVKARLLQKVEGALDTQHLHSIIARNALCEEVMDEKRLFAFKEEMEKAEARKLQPYFIRAFLNQAFAKLGGEVRARESGRFEITHVPAVVRERDRQLAGSDRRHAEPVQRRYERNHPGHPLMQSVTDLMLEQHRNKLKQGAVLVDPNDMGLTPPLFMIDHAVKEGSDPTRSISRRMQFVEIDPQGPAAGAGWAPHLDLEPIHPEDRRLIGDVLSAPWVSRDLEGVALVHASTHLVPEHFGEVKGRRERHVDKTLAAVHERLVKEINYWSDRYMKFQDELAAGKDVRLALENARRS